MIPILNWTDFDVVQNMVIKIQKNLEIISMPYYYFLLSTCTSLAKCLATTCSTCDSLWWLAFNWSSSNFCISLEVFLPAGLWLTASWSQNCFLLYWCSFKAAMKRLFLQLASSCKSFWPHPLQVCVAKLTLPTSFELFICILL